MTTTVYKLATPFSDVTIRSALARAAFLLEKEGNGPNDNGIAKIIDHISRELVADYAVSAASCEAVTADAQPDPASVSKKLVAGFPVLVMCEEGCQYAKDVGMSEHKCSADCRYLRDADVQRTKTWAEKA